MKYTTEWFIERARQIHGDKYDYSKVKYINDKNKVDIICRKHGIFSQIPSSHLQKHACKKCQYESNTIRDTYSQQEFIERANSIHNNKYDYSQTQYTKSINKIKIKCKEHGLFEQTADSHVNNASGCPICSKIKISKNQTLTKEQFIEKAHLVHNDIYDYSKVNYINYETKILIKCPEHDYFEQTPHCHLMTQGCPICRFSHGERIIYNWLKKNYISFKHGYRFPDCRNIKPLPFDFYFPYHNLCIEFDGRQHFENGRGHFKESLKNIQFRDSIKNSYCLKNNIRLIRIPYFKIKEIPTILAALFPAVGTNHVEAFPPKL